AHTAGSSAADENAALTLRLAPCPKCGAHDEGALRALKAKTIAGVIAALVLLPLFGVLLDGLKHNSFGLWIFVPIGVVCAWVIWAQQSWKWTTAARRVAFVP